MLRPSALHTVLENLLLGGGANSSLISLCFSGSDADWIMGRPLAFSSGDVVMIGGILISVRKLQSGSCSHEGLVDSELRIAASQAAFSAVHDAASWSACPNPLMRKENGNGAKGRLRPAPEQVT